MEKVRKKKKIPQGARFTPYVARFWCRMWMRCYKQGVMDAFESGDAGECREFLDYVSVPGQWGLLSRRRTDYLEDLLLWLSEMSRELEAWNVFQRYMRYLGRGTKCPYTLAYHVCQEFYNNGMRDYVNYPDACKLSVFRLGKDCLWSVKGLRKLKRTDVVEMALGILGDLQVLYEKHGYTRSPSVGSFRIFRRCIGQAREGYCNFS